MVQRILKEGGGGGRVGRGNTKQFLIDIFLREDIHQEMWSGHKKKNESMWWPDLFFRSFPIMEKLTSMLIFVLVYNFS